MSVQVKYKGKLVGKVVMNNNQYFFKYESAFLELGVDLAPLQMPINSSKEKIYSFPNLNPNTFYGLPGLIADSLPDKFGNNILNTWLNKKGKDLSSLNSLERLSYIGNRGMGALEFLPEIKNELFSNLDDAKINLNELSDISQQIISSKKDLKVNAKNNISLAQLIDVGTSAGGARAKALVSINDKTGEIKANHLKTEKDFNYYLVKFDTISDQTNVSTEVCLTEYAYYKMARKAGIDMMSSKLLEENGRFHFATKRFDRTNSGEKIHTQTLCAMGHYDYRDFTHNSYENLFYVARAINVDYRSREQLFRMMVLNVITRNLDDHSKNFGFLMTKTGKWKVSPAYDINFNYDPKGLFTQYHKMSINGKVENINRADLLELAKQNSINKPENIIDEIKEAASLFPQIAKNIGISEELSTYIASCFLMKI